MNDPAAVEAYLHEHIPISSGMGFRVLEASNARVLLEAPLEPNLNHRATAFGGSISAVAILAGWAMVHFRMRDEGLEVRTVIRESQVRYDAPVHEDFQAACAAPEATQWDRFVRTFQRRGKARIVVDVDLTSAGEPVGSFKGTYVVLDREKADASVPREAPPA